MDTALWSAFLAQDPNNALAHRLMGVVLMNAGYAHRDLDRARILLERAVELNPRDADIYRSAAVIYREQRLYDWPPRRTMLYCVSTLPVSMAALALDRYTVCSARRI